MKQLIQKAFAPFGYTFRRTSSLKPFVPFVRQIELPGASFRMWIANVDAEEWYSTEHWNKLAEFRALKELANPGDRVLEIGAHHGFTGLMLSRFVGENGKVLGVEANSNNALVDDAQITLNGFKNIQFINAAASDRPGKLKVETAHNARISDNGDSAEVEAVTGDMLDAKYGPFNVLKVDVEGYEVEVLKGCTSLLSRAPKLALELHVDLLPSRGHSLQDVFNLIDVGRYEGTMVVRPEFPFDLVPFSPSAIPHKNPKAEYLALNVFLKRKE